MDGQSVLPGVHLDPADECETETYLATHPRYSLPSRSVRVRNLQASSTSID